MKSTLVIAAGALLLSGGGAFAQDINDAQIASIVVTANQVDIDAGKLAQANSRNPEVKAFAERMVTDHAGVNTAAIELAGKLKVTPEDNATSRSLKSGGEKNLAHLGTLSGAAFDKAYVDHEVLYHQQVLDALDKTLIPGAKNGELKALLVKVRPAFVAHLEHARHIQDSLKQRQVSIEGMRFQPESITVQAGESVNWTNRDMFPHTATSPSAGFDSGQIDADGSWKLTASKKGDFAYTCALHPTMKGTLRVR